MDKHMMIKALLEIVLAISLLTIPAICCEIYIGYEDDEYLLIIDNVTRLDTAHINLTYDPSMILITDVVDGDLDFTFRNLEHNRDGFVGIGGYQTVDDVGINGTVVLAKTDIDITDEDTVMNISVITLKNPHGSVILHTVRNFSVSIPPSVTVGSPDGGEHWDVGTSQNIEWTATDNVGVTSIDIEYSTDGGATYHTIATSMPNNGTYCWTVPDTPSGACRVKVIACDAAGNTGWDVSNGDFTAAQPTTTDDSDDDDSSNGGGGMIHTPTPAPTPTLQPATPSATTTPAKEDSPAEITTPTPEKVTTFHTEPSSLPPPILSPIAAIVIVVIVAVFGIVRVISITTQVEDETHAEAIASIKQAECKKAITAIIGIVVVAVAAIIGIILMM